MRFTRDGRSLRAVAATVHSDSFAAVTDLDGAHRRPQLDALAY